MISINSTSTLPYLKDEGTLHCVKELCTIEAALDDELYTLGTALGDCFKTTQYLDYPSLRLKEITYTYPSFKKNVPLARARGERDATRRPPGDKIPYPEWGVVCVSCYAWGVCLEEGIH